MPSKSSALPTREANIFKQVVRLYEGKNVKKAIKAADTILKKFPNHGETLAMKGLSLNALDRKEEAHELVKKGLRLDMTSHICWHVYGLLYRSERDYREAAKAYLNALRIDKDNQQILRDLSLLQIQIRDFEGLEETRRKLLTIRPNYKNNWIGFALAFHLLGNYTTAIAVLDTYQDMPKGPDERAEDPYEISELLLYKNLILEEAGQFSDALCHLDANEKRIVDVLGLRETRARLLSRLGQHDQCAEVLRSLLDFNPDNIAYHRGLVNAAVLQARIARGECNENELSLSAAGDEKGPLTKEHLRKQLSVDVRIRHKADVEAALDICDESAIKFPRSHTSARIVLDLLPTGDHPQFIARLDNYVRPFLMRGVPSLFSDLKTLYSDSTKAAAAGRLFENYMASLLSAVNALPPRLQLPTSEADEEAEAEQKLEPEKILLWVYHYLAQHYDRIGQRTRALEFAEKAIETDSKTVECYLAKARILKHFGDLKGAVETLDTVRNMELSDRYLNTKCTKYGLRNNMVTQAENWIGLFTRDGDHGGPQALYEMQSMWFELEAAESHLRTGELSKALKKFTAVDRHFADMVEDQFDFHSYCLRKVTLRSYVSLLRFEDRIRGHPYYARCANGMIRTLLQLADLPEQVAYAYSGEHSDIEGFANMTEAERKKAISKKKKRAAKAKENAGSMGKSKKANAKSEAKSKAKTSGKAETKPNGTKGTKGKVEPNGTTTTTTGKPSSSGEKPKTNPGFMDIDPDGSELVKELLEKSKGKSPIEKAVQYVRELERHLENQIETHYLGFEVAFRRKRYLQALRAVRRAQAIDSEDPLTVEIAIRFSCEMIGNNGRATLSEVARQVYEAEGDVLGGKTPKDCIEAYENNAKDARRRLGAAVTRLRIITCCEKGAETLGSAQEACNGVVRAIERSHVEGSCGDVVEARELKKIIENLRLVKVGKTLIDEIVRSCREKHTRASCFVEPKTP